MDFPDRQQQRVALVRALAPCPRLVLLDEPFNGLDGGLRRRVAADTAAVLLEAGATAVLVTHDPGEAFAIADRIAVLEKGRVAQDAEPSVLYRCPSTLAVARLTGPTVELPGEMRGGVAETALGWIPVLGSVPDGRALVVLASSRCGRPTPSTPVARGGDPELRGQPPASPRPWPASWSSFRSRRSSARRASSGSW